MDHELDLAIHTLTFFICAIQILVNLIVLFAYFTDHQLVANRNIILLVSLAFVDFLYALLSIPYLLVLFVGWVPNGQLYNYSANVVLGFGSAPIALMKSGCTITGLIALDRICVLSFPLKYYTLDRKCFFYCGFVFALLLALLDFSLIFSLTKVQTTRGCADVICFTSQAFRTYFTVSNMAFKGLNFVLSVVAAVMLAKFNKNLHQTNNAIRYSADKYVNRASFYILAVSVMFGVIPSGITFCAQTFHFHFINTKMAFIILSLCASVSGLAHAFIFGMAHRGIRRRIGVMLK